MASHQHMQVCGCAHASCHMASRQHMQVCGTSMPPPVHTHTNTHPTCLPTALPPPPLPPGSSINRTLGANVTIEQVEFGALGRARG